MIARLKVALWRRCLAAYRAKPVVPVLRDRCSCIYIITLVERFVLTEIKIIIIIIIIMLLTVSTIHWETVACTSHGQVGYVRDSSSFTDRLGRGNIFWGHNLALKVLVRFAHVSSGAGIVKFCQPGSGS